MSIETRISKIKEQETKYGVKINLDKSDIINENYLDCLWYGGEVGSIEYKGYKIVIGAYGDVRIDGKINGHEIHFVDKNNCGDAYYDIGQDYNVDDKRLYALIDNPTKDNYLTLEDNNWFEVDIITPNGEFYDLCDWDNVLENNILDNFENVEDYFEYVDEIIEDETALIN